MRALLLAATVVFAAVAGLEPSKFGGIVHRLSVSQFVAMSAGKPIPNIDDPNDKWYGGNRHRGVWAVRFVTVPDADPATNEDAAGFHAAAAATSPWIARFADFVLDTPEKWAMADLLQVGLGELRLFHAAVPQRNPDITKGMFVSDRLFSVPPKMEAGKERKPWTAESVTGFIYGNLPSTFVDPHTHLPSESILYAERREDAMAYARQLRAARPAGQPITHTCVIHMSLISSICANTAAATYAAAAMVRGRGGALPMLCESRMGETFGDWHAPREESRAFVESKLAEQHPTDAPVTIVNFRLNAAGTDIDPASVVKKHFVYDPAVIADFIFTAAEESESFESEQTRVAQSDLWVQQSIGQLLAPTSAKGAMPLRRLHQRAQFTHELQPLKNGVNVLFWLRESDRAFSAHLKVAKAVAEDVLTDFTIEINERKQTMAHQVFMIDAEAQKAAAKALGVTAVPSVAVALHLNDGKKGIRFLKVKEFPSKAKDIIKFIRETAFDGKDTTPHDDLDAIPWVDEELAPPTDPALETKFLFVDQRQWREGVPKPLDVLKQLAMQHRPWPGMTATTDSGSRGGGDTQQQKSDKAAGKKTAEELAAKEKKKKELAEKRKKKAEEEKIKAKEELERKQREKTERMAAKRAEEETKKKQKADDIEKRAKAQQERQAREELDGTAERRREAQRKSEERKKLMTEAKAKAKTRKAKTQKALAREWTSDTQEIVEKYLKESDNGAADIVDAIL